MLNRNTLEPATTKSVQDRRYLFGLALLVLLLIMIALLIVAAKDSSIKNQSVSADHISMNNLDITAKTNNSIEREPLESTRERYDDWDELPDVIAPSFDYKQVDIDIPETTINQEKS